MYTQEQLQRIARLALAVRAHGDVLVARIDGLMSFAWTEEDRRAEDAHIKLGLAEMIAASVTLDLYRKNADAKNAEVPRIPIA